MDEQEAISKVKGLTCPNCGSKMETPNEYSTDWDVTTYSIDCEKCGESWMATYDIRSIERMDEGEKQ